VGLKCETKRLGEWLKHNKCQLDIEDLMERIEKVNEEIESEMRSMDFAIGLSYFMRKGRV
jgi:tetrahydromethanopterin S-methyltransferase subunit B